MRPRWWATRSLTATSCFSSAATSARIACRTTAGAGRAELMSRHYSISGALSARCVCNILKIMCQGVCYSRGIRQRLYKIAQEQDWAEQHAILIGAREDIPGDYSQLLARSKFCLVAPGAQHSPRSMHSLCSCRTCLPISPHPHLNTAAGVFLGYSLVTATSRSSSLWGIVGCELLQKMRALHTRSAGKGLVDGRVLGI